MRIFNFQSWNTQTLSIVVVNLHHLTIIDFHVVSCHNKCFTLFYINNVFKKLYCVWKLLILCRKFHPYFLSSTDILISRWLFPFFWKYLHSSWYLIFFLSQSLLLQVLLKLKCLLFTCLIHQNKLESHTELIMIHHC